MLERTSVIAALVVVLAACGSSSDSSNGGGPATTPTCTEGSPGCLGWVDCPAGFERETGSPETPEANACRDVQPDADCAPGTMPTLGSKDCRPVGPTECAAGFVRSASGWGCDEVLPATACTGATRESLGSTTCQPVGDCNAPFPPANATLFVNAAYTDPQLDAAHFRTIDAAVTAAPAGAVIAVEAGIYSEGIGPTRAVTIVGRCAQKVRLFGSALEFPGVFSRGVKNIVVSGLSLEGHFQGVRAEGGGSITVSDVIIESPRLSGLIAYQPGSVVTASRVVVRKAQRGKAAGAGAAADAGGKLDLTDVVLAGSSDVGVNASNFGGESKTPTTVTGHRVVVIDTNPTRTGAGGSGAASFDGSSISLEDSVIRGTFGFGVLVQSGGATASLKNTVVRGTLQSPAEPIAGGVVAFDHAMVTLDGVSLFDNAQSGTYVRNSKLTMNGSVVVGSKPETATGDFGMGVWADQGANVDVANTAIVDNAYYGMAAFDPSTALHASGTLVRGTKRNKADVLGRGLNVEAAAAVALEDVAFVGNGDESIFVRGGVAGKGRSHLTATRIIVRDTASRGDGSRGDGIVVQGGGLLELDMAAVVRARRAGILLNDLLGPDGSPAEATVTHAVVRDTLAAGDALGAAKGIALEGVGIASGGKLALRASAVSGNVEFGIVFGGANSSGTIESTIIRSTSPRAAGDYGHGFVGVDGTSVVFKSTIILGNRIGLAFESSSATLTDVLVQKNAVGIHVQGDSQLQTAAVAPAEPTPATVIVADDSRFVDNDTRVGSGVVPLPKGPLGPTEPAGNAPGKTK
jgi:hypothetical protein